MLIKQVAEYLETHDLGTLGEDLFYSYLPDDTDICLAVLDTGGTAPSIDIPTKSPTFQVFIRSNNYEDGKQKLDKVRSLLHNQYNVQLVASGVYFYSINAVAEGGYIGRHEVTGQDEFSINFKCLTR
jgi:hypothetical protein